MITEKRRFILSFFTITWSTNYHVGVESRYVTVLHFEPGTPIRFLFHSNYSSRQYLTVPILGHCGRTSFQQDYIIVTWMIVPDLIYLTHENVHPICTLTKCLYRRSRRCITLPGGRSRLLPLLIPTLAQTFARGKSRERVRDLLVNVILINEWRPQSFLCARRRTLSIRKTSRTA
jgi:hypothetical protein